MRRILLLLAVSLVMVVMALPSAGAQGEPTQFCVSGIIFDPVGGPDCFDTLEECLANLDIEGDECSELTQSEISSIKGTTEVDQRVCQDPRDRPPCQNREQ